MHGGTRAESLDRQPIPRTPEQLAWLEKRNEAVRIYRETGDDTMAIEIGLFPPHDFDPRSVDTRT